MNEALLHESARKSHAGDDSGIPPFKKRRVGHPARETVQGSLDSAGASLREVPARLRMTTWIGFQPTD